MDASSSARAGERRSLEVSSSNRVGSHLTHLLSRVGGSKTGAYSSADCYRKTSASSRALRSSQSGMHRRSRRKNAGLWSCTRRWQSSCIMTYSMQWSGALIRSALSVMVPALEQLPQRPTILRIRSMGSVLGKLGAPARHLAICFRKICSACARYPASSASATLLGSFGEPTYTFKKRPMSFTSTSVECRTRRRY